MANTQEEGRCARCGWTLAASAKEGCFPGHCWYVGPPEGAIGGTLRESVTVTTDGERARRTREALLALRELIEHQDVDIPIDSPAWDELARIDRAMVELGLAAGFPVGTLVEYEPTVGGVCAGTICHVEAHRVWVRLDVPAEPACEVFFEENELYRLRKR